MNGPARKCQLVVPISNHEQTTLQGSGCDSVRRWAASDTRGLWFESSNPFHQFGLTFLMFA